MCGSRILTCGVTGVSARCCSPLLWLDRRLGALSTGQESIKNIKKRPNCSHRPRIIIHPNICGTDSLKFDQIHLHWGFSFILFFQVSFFNDGKTEATIYNFIQTTGLFLMILWVKAGHNGSINLKQTCIYKFNLKRLRAIDLKHKKRI